jgi:hypothetical protein
MNKELFITLLDGVREYNDYFMMKKDCTKIVRFSCIQKCTDAMMMLAYEYMMLVQMQKMYTYIWLDPQSLKICTI